MARQILPQFIQRQYVGRGRFLTIFLIFAIASFFILATLMSSEGRFNPQTLFSNKYPTPLLNENYGPLSTFLQSNGIGPDKTLFVAMAGGLYIDPVINFKKQLEIWSLEQNYLVLCLDVACMEATKRNSILAYGGYLQTEEESKKDFHAPVARMKFGATLDMLDGGYNFLLIDADVYLTGTHHPLSKMLQLSDPTWDIQFQSDDWDGMNPDVVNIGWYWARPRNSTREIFLRSQAAWDAYQGWDQNIVNGVIWAMTREGNLTYRQEVRMLNQSYYARMDVIPWEAISLDPKLIDRLNSKIIMLHYTGFVHLTKTYLSKHFGHWVNETYYTQHIPLLQPINVSGTGEEILAQITLAIYLARLSGRTFMWPMSVNRTWFGTNIYEERPTITVVDDDAVTKAISWVEATYLHNRARYTNVPLTEHTLSVTIEDFHKEGRILDLVRESQSSLVDLVKVDFGNVSGAEIIRSEWLTNIFQEVVLWEKVTTWLPTKALTDEFWA